MANTPMKPIFELLVDLYITCSHFHLGRQRIDGLLLVAKYANVLLVTVLGGLFLTDSPSPHRRTSCPVVWQGLTILLLEIDLLF